MKSKIGKVAFLCAFLLAAACAKAAPTVDGFAIGIKFKPEGEFGNIHEGIVPGQLIRYDVRKGAVVGQKVLVEEPEVVFACLDPFGQRIAYTRKNNELVIIPADGGEKRLSETSQRWGRRRAANLTGRGYNGRLATAHAGSGTRTTATTR